MNAKFLCLSREVSTTRAVHGGDALCPDDNDMLRRSGQLQPMSLYASTKQGGHIDDEVGIGRQNAVSHARKHGAPPCWGQKRSCRTRGRGCAQR